MVKVAIAGGTGDLGRTIVEVMENHPHHQAIILSRKPKEPVAGAPVLVVDYTDVAALTRTLEENGIHTVISALGYHGDSLATAQLNLIRAAAASAPTKRFAPSAYAVRYPRSACAMLPTLNDYFGAIDALRASGLEWTVFLNGLFLDYFSHPHARSYLKPLCFAIDLASCKAAIPGDGEQKVTFTYTFDVARFVVAALDLEVWEEESCIAGDTVTWNEFVRMAEEVRGTKFNVVYDDVEKLKRGELTELPGHVATYGSFPKELFQGFMSMFEQFTTDEKISVVPPELNKKFPEIKPLTVREMLKQYWADK
ncbi:uncharacterized protein LTHEOB_12152 [Lasiodiplodia theobromae]|uniref:NmrA-like domain-containing protein n=1 Tax=Lasiodiplodia theobromae TaxID=45133 RepID=A0A5N5D886_9PEZI|nr:uncharacterized protein LTHEOB_12152 [Lasiodiplodia theobromae]KAB2574023.1 hypothetical protein DBV05_g7287 [Lasiodiplodia theobromae]KAF4536568.1 hypothetical protein LTHEOB_12152 [Lasiodiplodia theobromae]